MIDDRRGRRRRAVATSSAWAMVSDALPVMTGRNASVYQLASRLGLKKSAEFFASDLSGRIARGKMHPRMIATQFKPGSKPWNAGTHYVAGGRSAETRFKPGTRPHTWLPVGSYRISGDNQLERKMNNNPGANHVRWHPVARLVWEAAHGTVPTGSMVVFKPGRKSLVLERITLDAVECITRAENARRNHPRNKSPEIATLVQIKGQITRQVNRLAREQEQST